jgi:hypothetical protein
MHRYLILCGGIVCALTTACSDDSGRFIGVDSGSSSGSSSGGSSGSSSGGTGDDGGTDACVAYVAPDADLTTPTVAFAKDVLPTFQRSCGIAGATCHGATSVVKVDNRPYLGQFDGGTDAAVVVNGLVGVASYENPSAVMVTAGNPGASFLMHKLDGDQCTFAAQCAQGQSQYTDCGQQMPYSSSALDQKTRDTVRRWIAQGAQNN